MKVMGNYKILCVFDTDQCKTHCLKKITDVMLIPNVCMYAVQSIVIALTVPCRLIYDIALILLENAVHKWHLFKYCFKDAFAHMFH
jgi:hypothetical protein